MTTTTTEQGVAQRTAEREQRAAERAEQRAARRSGARKPLSRPGESGRMTLGRHLVELRKRLTISALAIVIGMVAGFAVSGWAIEMISAPIQVIAEETGNATLNFDSVTMAFDLRMKIAFTLGFVVSSPVWLFQIWAFFVPALTRSEIGYALGFILTAVPLFFAGCFAGWTVMPHVIELMAGFTPDGGINYFQAAYYYDFVLKLVVVVGVAFVLPVFLVLLNFVGVLSARAIIGGWRFAILLITVFCAIATPAADVISMFLLAIPMIVLYFAAWGVAVIHDHRVAKKLALITEGLDAAEPNTAAV